MAEPFLAFLASCLMALVLTPPVIQWAVKIGALDIPGERKVHDHPVPRIGGAAVVLALLTVGLGAFSVAPHLRQSFTENLPFWGSLALSGMLVFFLGLYDDLRHASITLKFAVQLLAAAGVMAFGGVRIQRLGIPFDGSVDLAWLGIPLTALWIVGVTNAFNLIDGLDGLAGGVAFISSMTLFIVALLNGDRYRVVLVAATLSGALLGFLRYNRYPAKIFLGDSGSMVVGFILAVLSVVGSVKRTAALALLIPILIVGVPVFDTLFAMGRRLLKKILVERDFSLSAFGAMFRADRAHIHHVLMEMGYSHRKAVLVLYGLSSILGVFAVAAAIIQNDQVSFGLILAGIAGFIVVRQFGGIRFRREAER